MTQQLEKLINIQKLLKGEYGNSGLKQTINKMKNLLPRVN